VAEPHVHRADFYVYVLFRADGRPFYVGKGRRDRWLCHERDIRKMIPSHNHRKDAIIRQMLSAGLAEVPKIKIHEGLTERCASAYEIALIAAIGRAPDGLLVNLTAGGEGISGYSSNRGRVASPETRAKISAANRGRVHSPETRAKMSAKIMTAEQRAKISAAHRGRRPSPQTIAASIAARRNKPMSEKQRKNLEAPKFGSQEHRAKLRAKQLGVSPSVATRAKLRRANLGKTMDAEVRAKLRAFNLGKMLTSEHRAKIAASQTGKIASPETKAKLRASHLGKAPSQETRARMRAAQRMVWQSRRDRDHATSIT
jgi:hypothetical protein